MALRGKRARFVAEYVAAHFKGLRGEGITDAEVATRAGYSARSAYSQANRLLKNDEVKKAIEEGKRHMQSKTALTLESHLAKLEQLEEEARKAGNMGAAIRAEELRGKASGFYVDLTKDVSNELSDEQVIMGIKEQAGAEPALALARKMGLSADKLRDIFGEDAVGPKAA